MKKDLKAESLRAGFENMGDEHEKKLKRLRQLEGRNACHVQAARVLRGAAESFRKRVKV